MTGADALAGLSKPVRAFVALPCPDGVRRSIAAGLDGWRALGADIAWADPGRIHLTLRFLGDAGPDSLRRLDTGLREAAGRTGPIEARVGPVGAFPGWRRPRVFWLGLESGGAVERLAADVEIAARAAGFDPEERPFTPHLTLGRVRSPRGIRPTIAALRDWDVDDRLRRIDEIVLYRSRLGPGGARHDALAAHRLGGPGD